MGILASLAPPTSLLLNAELRLLISSVSFSRWCLLHAMGTVQAKRGATSKDNTYKVGEVPPPKVTFTEDQLRTKLTDEEYNVTQGKGIDM